MGRKSDLCNALNATLSYVYVFILQEIQYIACSGHEKPQLIFLIIIYCTWYDRRKPRKIKLVTLRCVFAYLAWNTQLCTVCTVINRLVQSKYSRHTLFLHETIRY